MKKYITWSSLLLLLLLSGCGLTETEQRAEAGHIGSESAISRAMAAKTIALAFATNQEMAKAETKLDFSDLSAEDWAYPYIACCVEQGFFAGSEEGSFRPEDDLTLWEAQTLMDRLAPDYDSRIVLTAENKNMAVSYELWVQLLETALQARRGEDSLYSYGIRTENAVLLDADGLCDTGKFTAEGVDLTSYTASRITFLEKDGEILALLTVEAAAPIVRNIYCRWEKGTLFLETGAGTAAFAYGKALDEGIYDIKLKNGAIAEVTAAEAVGGGTVKRVDGETIYLAERGELPWAEAARVYDASGTEIVQADFSDLICGTDCGEFFEKDGAICAAVIRTPASLERIRVFLKGEAQEGVTLSAEGGFTLSSSSNQKTFSQATTLRADLPWFSHGIVTATAETPIRVAFTDGTVYQYEGTLELERRGTDRLVIINELPLERYLLGVVPNEMPTSFGQAALQAQAIVARGYAYHRFYANAYAAYGAHLTDSTANQVYLGYAANEAAEQAIRATEGLCVVTGTGRVAQTYFYSASCGFGAGNQEAWSKDGSFSGKGKAYLQAQAYGDFITPQTEEEWLAFWQDWEKKGYDMDAPWYRWKVYFSCGQLTEILQETLAESGNCSIEGNQKELGRLTGVAVTRRGRGGIAMELRLSFEKGTATVKTENAIRKALSPKKRTLGETIYLQRRNAETLTGISMLPSGFFAVREMKNEEGKLTGVALYGGGNGHGVGMSQYGAKYLAAQGKTAAEILACYFPGTRVERVV